MAPLVNNPAIGYKLPMPMLAPIYPHVTTVRTTDAMIAEIRRALGPGESMAAWLRDEAIEKLQNRKSTPKQKDQRR